jgi:hypothetical protein
LVSLNARQLFIEHSQLPKQDRSLIEMLREWESDCRTRLCLKSLKPAEFATRSVAMTLARPFKAGIGDRDPLRRRVSDALEFVDILFILSLRDRRFLSCFPTRP